MSVSVRLFFITDVRDDVDYLFILSFIGPNFCPISYCISPFSSLQSSVFQLLDVLDRDFGRYSQRRNYKSPMRVVLLLARETLCSQFRIVKAFWPYFALTGMNSPRSTMLNSVESKQSAAKK